MLETIFRPALQRWIFDPLAYTLTGRLPLSANGLTLLSALLGLGGAVYLALSGSVWASVLLLLGSGFFDILDGSFARASHTSSELGSLFDLTADRLVEFAIIFALFWLDPVHRAVMSMLMLGSVLLCITSFLGVGIFHPQQGEKSFYYSAGLMERGEAFAFFFAMIIWPQYFTGLAAVFSVLVFYTAGYRLYEFYRHARAAAL